MGYLRSEANPLCIYLPAWQAALSCRQSCTTHRQHVLAVTPRLCFQCSLGVCSTARSGTCRHGSHQNLAHQIPLLTLLMLMLKFMICHSNKCHKPRTSTCYKQQQGGIENGISSACMTTACLNADVLIVTKPVAVSGRVGVAAAWQSEARSRVVPA